MKRHKIYSVGPERFRIGPFHADHAVAYVAVDSVGTEPTPGAVELCVERVRSLGYASIITAALRPSEAHAFTKAGFVEYENLVVLSHDLLDIPAVSTRRVRRARAWERRTALGIDAAAFDEFWQLDGAGLREAFDATPRIRFTLVHNDDREPIGYAVCGLTEDIGYLQRLAIHPGERGRGHAQALVIDALRWLRRRSATRALVNTQELNDAALGLYERLGFRPEHERLTVLCSDC